MWCSALLWHHVQMWEGQCMHPSLLGTQARALLNGRQRIDWIGQSPNSASLMSANSLSPESSTSPLNIPTIFHHNLELCLQICLNTSITDVIMPNINASLVVKCDTCTLQWKNTLIWQIVAFNTMAYVDLTCPDLLFLACLPHFNSKQPVKYLSLHFQHGVLVSVLPVVAQ